MAVLDVPQGSRCVEKVCEMTHCFAAWTKNGADRAQSTSGGMFSAIARHFLADGGMVVAAKYGEGLRIEHGVAERAEDLDYMRGVKYAQGVIGKDVYAAVRRILPKRRIAFFGLPCQCAAMRKLFGRDGNLLIVDLVCFGAPSMRLWQKYVEWLEWKQGKRLVSVNPRYKGHGWSRKTYYRYEWDDGSASSQLSLFDPYAQAFYSALGFRRCCFACPFRGIERQTDMTIGDCWGVENMGLGLSEEEIGRGVSGVLVHNERAQKIFDGLDIWSREISVAAYVKENSPLVASPKMPDAWPEFSKDAASLDFGDLIEKWNLKVSRTRFIINGIKSVARRILGRTSCRTSCESHAKSAK